MKAKNEMVGQPQSSPENNIESLIKELKEVKRLLLLKTTDESVCPDWIQKSKVQEYLDYGDTQIATLIANKEVQTTTIGRRKFISRHSIKELLERNID